MNAKFLYADVAYLFKAAIAERITVYKYNRERFRVETNYMGVEVKVTDRTNGAVVFITLDNHSTDEIPTPYSVTLAPIQGVGLHGTPQAQADFNESAGILRGILGVQA